MAVRVVSNGPAEVLMVNCDKCCHTLEFTFEDVKPHRTDGDGDAYERKGPVPDMSPFELQRAHMGGCGQSRSTKSLSRPALDPEGRLT